MSGVVVTPAIAYQNETTISAGTAAEEHSADWYWVRYLAKAHPYSSVRTSAWNALVSGDPDAAIVEFLATGYDFAVSRAQLRNARNLDFVRRVYETTTAEYSPEVHNEAQRLLSASDSARETFVRSGYEAAKSRDRAYRDTVGAQKQALVDSDRRFVGLLATNDPGEQVRLSAQVATRQGATDDDLVEFFAFGWANGARLDLDVFRLRGADNNMRWRDTITRLIADAEAAEKAARDASAEAKEQAKAQAARAWQQVGEQTAPARSGWGEAEDFARRQAENWHAVLLAAQAAQGPNWTAIIDPATASESAWQSEQSTAAQQAAYWNALLQQARDGEQRVQHS